ncbi:hypothetical protein BT96DRAFT_979605 [Gymnopus androsaceus JB14]|uniref:Glycosyl hydrolase family 13 catalytic domain-containing protein n=1 Tax=Gymnopus androsaceus JB14 TaxID=1447944 RepID=A0A6A4H1B4_9AGAR|nr:hypothetical protein BT96DRAFT_979605 [Gymnopus androsaceus JB14]
MTRITWTSILLDKWADGDPSNNDFFGTIYEWEYRETQLRFGGDLKGLVSRFDYLQGMGIKVIYVAGTPFLNMIWQADSYSPLDMTVLDLHWGTWDDWVATIDEIHACGMYFMADLTVGTMSDLLGFTGFLNMSAPFSINEYDTEWVLPSYMPWNFTAYKDFEIINTQNNSCVYPTFWDNDGTIIPKFIVGATRTGSVSYQSLPPFRIDFASGKLTVRYRGRPLLVNVHLISGRIISTFLVKLQGETPLVQSTCNLTSSESSFFLRDEGNVALDGCAFHYSIYRALTRFLGMDGNLAVAYEVDTNFITAWSKIFVDNDFINSQTNELDPRHMYGTSNFDLFRWPSLANGTQRSALETFITFTTMERSKPSYAYDDTANNYLYGRQSMVANQAWKRHGCYQLGSDQYFNMPLDKSALGCYDDWSTLDHFDPTADSRHLFAQYNYLRTQYAALQDSYLLTQLGNWTEYIQREGSNGTVMEMGLWSVSRSEMTGAQNLTGSDTSVVWMLYSNENSTITWTYPVIMAPGFRLLIKLKLSSRIFSILTRLTFLRNPENLSLMIMHLHTLDVWAASLWMATDSKPWFRWPTGLLPFLLSPLSPLAKHGVTNSISMNMSTSSTGSVPTISNVSCGNMTSSANVIVQGVSHTTWVWNATLTNFPDGILTITLNKPSSTGGISTGAVDTVLLRKGLLTNVMVFPESDYNSSSLTKSGDDYIFTHTAIGTDMFRYSWNFGQNWTSWTTWEDTTMVKTTFFADADLFRDGDHIMVQYWSALALSSTHAVHADYGWSGFTRRVPQFIATGVFNEWGDNQGIANTFSQVGDGCSCTTGPPYFQVHVWDESDDFYYGDVNSDGVLDCLPPNTEATNYLNMSAPPKPHLSWMVQNQLFPNLWRKSSDSKDGAAISEKKSEKKFFSHKHHSDIISWPEDKSKRRKVLIATLEYEIIDWKLKVKIGGLGVMSSLIGKAMSDVDLLWVVPKVKDIEYPASDPAEPIEVIIFGEPYLIEVETHVLDNITYFQGLWPLRTKEEMKEICLAFNISKEHCTKYVQFGNTFNLLHAAACFISVHQKSIGVACVSDKYGKRSWARYPALWTLKHEVEVDHVAKSARPENKRQAQEWAGLKQDPKSDLFVFVSHWSKQKGVNLIADVMPLLLEKRPSIQLITVGPVIVLYGCFASEKLARLIGIFLFSSADFALIPSHDEPFSLVAVEFVRKGALGWFPMESSSTAHMLSQLTKTIKMALKSTEERANLRARSAVQRFPILSNIATWCYTVASAAAFMVFGLNFGEEAGAGTEVWMLRACIVQGSQQLWVAALWYWGYKLNTEAVNYTPPWICVAVWSLSILCFYSSSFFFMAFLVPNFLRTLFRRRIVIWFLVSVVLQSYWLSGPYGQNWHFLWNSELPTWQILLLVLAFFIGVWSLMLFVLTHFSKTHTWLLPIFAVGLGAPRWCQILWGTSGIAYGGLYLAIGLWLWLGVLDSVQGVGLSSRSHDHSHRFGQGYAAALQKNMPWCLSVPPTEVSIKLTSNMSTITSKCLYMKYFHQLPLHTSVYATEYATLPLGRHLVKYTFSGRLSARLKYSEKSHFIYVLKLTISHYASAWLKHNDWRCALVKQCREGPPIHLPTIAAGDAKVKGELADVLEEGSHISNEEPASGQPVEKSGSGISQHTKNLFKSSRIGRFLIQVFRRRNTQK